MIHANVNLSRYMIFILAFVIVIYAMATCQDPKKNCQKRCEVTIDGKKQSHWELHQANGVNACKCIEPKPESEKAPEL